MKKLILAFAFFCFTSLAFANSFDSFSERIVCNDSDLRLSFIVTGTHEEMLREVKSIAEMNMRVKACTVTVTVQSGSGEPVTGTFIAETCKAAGEIASVFLKAVISKD